jgi:hypothetical protein
MKGTVDQKTPRYLVEWEMVLKLVEYCLINDAEEAPRAFEIGILALIPKDVTSYRGIVLLESIYNLVSFIITRRLTEAIEFHDALHGFRGGRGTGTAIIELKLLIQHTKRPQEGILLAGSRQDNDDPQGLRRGKESAGFHYADMGRRHAGIEARRVLWDPV